MCGTRSTFSRTETKFFVGVTEIPANQLQEIPDFEYHALFPNLADGFTRKSGAKRVEVPSMAKRTDEDIRREATAFADFWAKKNGWSPEQVAAYIKEKMAAPRVAVQRFLVTRSSPPQAVSRVIKWERTEKPTICGPKCRNARGPSCDCICEGKFHGASVGMSRTRFAASEIDLKPTEQMASNAARGLELREKHGKGGTAVGVARARDIKNRANLSPSTVRRMHSFFSRHEGNQKGGEDDAGYIAWLLWGGDAGKSWAARKSEQLDKSESARFAMVSNLKIGKGRDEDSRVFTAVVNGSEIKGKLVKGWSRLGGWGWTASIEGVDATGGAQMSSSMRTAVERAADWIKSASSRSRFSHDIRLPKGKRRLNIDEAHAALAQMGYRLGTVRYDPAAGGSVYKVTQPNGSVVDMPAAKLTDFIYEKAKHMKSGTKTAFAEYNTVQAHEGYADNKFYVTYTDANGGNDVFGPFNTMLEAKSKASELSKRHGAKLITSRAGAKSTHAAPRPKFNLGDKVAIMDGARVLDTGVIDYAYGYDDFQETYKYKVSTESGARKTWNEESLKKMSRAGAKAKFGNADALLDLASGYIADGDDEAGLLLTDLVKMKNRGLLSADQQQYLSKLIQEGRAMGVFSRAGAKSKFAATVAGAAAYTKNLVKSLGFYPDAVRFDTARDLLVLEFTSAPIIAVNCASKLSHALSTRGVGARRVSITQSMEQRSGEDVGVVEINLDDVASKGLNSRAGAKSAFAANNVDLWNFLSKSDFVIARQNANDLANLKKYASMALTMPDFTPPAHQQHGPSLHTMAKDVLADIKKWEQAVYRYKNRAPWARTGAKAAFAITTYEQAEHQIALAEERIRSVRAAVSDTEKWIHRANGAMQLADAGNEMAAKEVISIARMIESAMNHRGFSRAGAKAKFGYDPKMYKLYNDVTNAVSSIEAALLQIGVGRSSNGYTKVYAAIDKAYRAANEIANAGIMSRAGAKSTHALPVPTIANPLNRTEHHGDAIAAINAAIKSGNANEARRLFNLYAHTLNSTEKAGVWGIIRKMIGPQFSRAGAKAKMGIYGSLVKDALDALHRGDIEDAARQAEDLRSLMTSNKVNTLEKLDYTELLKELRSRGVRIWSRAGAKSDRLTLAQRIAVEHDAKRMAAR